MRKKIAFISPVWEWWPKVLYRDLVELLNEKYPEYEYFLVSSVKEWIKLHFFNSNYDLIISSVPFFWKPFNCQYILNVHWLYRNDRWFKTIWALLNWFYPYNNIFSKLILFPSEFLKKYYNSNHKNQKVILNFSNFPIIKNETISLKNKDEINLLTITWFSFYDKARGLLDIFEKLQKINIDKKINFYICWDWKYLSIIKEKLHNYNIASNIKIIFLWKLDKNQLFEILNKSDIFLYSTFQDTFWISIIEAMSFWLPIILNKYELFNELFDKEFVAKDNIDFVKKIEKLINNQNYYSEYLNKSYKNLEKFDKNIIINEWYQLIKEQIN